MVITEEKKTAALDGPDVDDNSRENLPESVLKRLKDLADEVARAGGLAGPLSSEDEHRIQGLVFALAEVDPTVLNRLLDRADFFVRLSSDGMETLKSMADIIKENKRLKTLCTIDPKIGLFNGRYFKERLSVELERVKRTEKPCGLIMMDLDRFKPVNDQFGHLAGDRVLEAVAEIIKSSVRAVDVPARYGGDEFAIILPDTSVDKAVGIAERIRQRLETDIRTARYGVTASFGISAVHHYDLEDAESLIERADEALYRAKSLGGNHVFFFETEKEKEATTEITVAERDALYFSLVPEDED